MHVCVCVCVKKHRVTQYVIHEYELKHHRHRYTQALMRLLGLMNLALNLFHVINIHRQ